MKKILALVCFLMVAAACSTGPTTNTPAGSNANTTAAKSTAPVSEAEMIAKEKAAWDTLKTKDYDAFGNLLASDYIEVTDDGVFDKAGILASVKDFNLSDATFSGWKMIPVDNDAVILTYDLNLKGKFKGQDVPPGPYHAAAAWVNRGGKWQGFYYQQTMVKTMPPPRSASPGKTEKAAATPLAKPAETGPDPIANEKIVWDTFKRKDYDAFAALLASEATDIEPYGVYDKAGSVKSVSTFDASRFELSDWKSVKLDNDASLVTYLVKPDDPKMDTERHTTIWVNRGGKWLALLHVGTPVAKPPAKPETRGM